MERFLSIAALIVWVAMLFLPFRPRRALERPLGSVFLATYLSSSMSPQTTVFRSERELVMLYNLHLLEIYGNLEFQVRSYRNNVVVSEQILYQPLDGDWNPLASNDDSIWPEIASHSPAAMPFLVPGGPPNQESTLRGHGFQPGAKVFASVDDRKGPKHQIESRYISNDEMTASIPFELWRERLTFFRIVVHAKTGESRPSR